MSIGVCMTERCIDYMYAIYVYVHTFVGVSSARVAGALVDDALHYLLAELLIVFQELRRPETCIERVYMHKYKCISSI